MMDNTGHTLKPCPWCGEQPKIYDGIGQQAPRYSIGCKKDRIFFMRNTPEECIERWNTRTSPPQSADVDLVKLEKWLLRDGESLRCPDAFFGNVVVNLERLKLLDQAARLYLAERKQRVAVPDGWKLVPVEPTDVMLNTAMSYFGTDPLLKQPVLNAYKAMLAAAPQPPKENQ